MKKIADFAMNAGGRSQRLIASIRVMISALHAIHVFLSKPRARSVVGPFGTTSWPLSRRFVAIAYELIGCAFAAKNRSPGRQ